MKSHALVYPMFAMVLLTFSTLARLFVTRVRFVREGAVDAAYFKTYQEGSEPEASAQLSRNFANLFEAPTLFYVACLAALAVGQSSTALTLLAWAYVLARAVHAWIHTGRNELSHRIAAYFASWAVLLAMWAWLVVGALTAES